MADLPVPLRTLLEASLSGPTVAGTVLLAVCGLYWAMLILGAADLHLFDFDLHAEMDHADLGHADVGHHDFGSWGLVALKFLNVGDVPLMIWLSLFAGSYWAASVLFDGTASFGDDWQALAVGIVRAGAVGLAGAKLLTQPMRGKFDTVEPNAASTLIGRVCVVTSSEVTPTFGQATLDAGAAPLILHIRGPAGVLHRNDPALIAGYDAPRGVFLVVPVPAGSPFASDQTARE